MKDIVVLYAGDAKRALTVVADKPFGWLYLGQNIKQKEDIIKVLGRENRYFTVDLLQKVASQQKQPFLDFIAELGSHQKNMLHWWASNIAYRNTFMPCNLFLFWCYLVIFEKVCSEKSDEKLLIVLIEDHWLYRQLWVNYREEGEFSFLSRKSALPELLKTKARASAGRTYILLNAAFQALRSRSVPSKARVDSNKKDKKQVHIYSWIQDRFFGENEKFNDAYFGRLPEMLAADSFDVAYISQPFISEALKRKCLDYDKYEFNFLDRYISLSDILKCLFTSFQIFHSNQQKKFKILLQRQAAHEISSVPSHLLYYFAFKRWLTQINHNAITIVYPFENQPWEKMLCTATKESGKNIKLIAYQHSVVPPLLLNYFLGAGESDIMPLPHVIVTNGEHTLELLKNANYGNANLINGGALRYEHLYQEKSSHTKEEQKTKTVLVALPYLAKLALEMFLVAINSLQDENIRVIIKPHPIVPLERLKIRPLHWPVHFQKTDKPMQEILREVDLVVYSSTTTGLEAFLAGIPVIKYYSEHFLDLDTLSADGSAVKSCFENNMGEVILSALKENGSYTTQTRNIEQFFSPVNEDVWKQVVKY